MEKTTQRFRRIATTLADLNAEGLNAQTVNDLLTMYVGAASQHVLRMSFVPEQEDHNVDRQVTPHRRNKSPPSKETSRNNFLTASPTHPLNKPFSYHNPLHALVRTSCSRAVKRMRLRIAASAFL